MKYPQFQNELSFPNHFFVMFVFLTFLHELSSSIQETLFPKFPSLILWKFHTTFLK